jgi:hypothetical protein
MTEPPCHNQQHSIQAVKYFNVKKQSNGNVFTKLIHDVDFTFVHKFMDTNIKHFQLYHGPHGIRLSDECKIDKMLAQHWQRLTELNAME